MTTDDAMTAARSGSYMALARTGGDGGSTKVPMSVAEATLIVRVHSRTDIRGAAEFKVLLATTSPTPGDPTSDFIHPTPIATATINSSTAAPTLVVEQLTPGFGAQLTVFVEATQGATGANPIEVELSAELVLKA